MSWADAKLVTTLQGMPRALETNRRCEQPSEGADCPPLRSRDHPTCAGHRSKHPALPITDGLTGLCVPVAQDFHAAPPEHGTDASLVAVRPFPQQHSFIVITVYLRWAQKVVQNVSNQQTQSVFLSNPSITYHGTKHSGHVDGISPS